MIADTCLFNNGVLSQEALETSLDASKSLLLCLYAILASFLMLLYLASMQISLSYRKI